MKPSVFVGSTEKDLRNEREAIRRTITELSYVPIMSDFGDIGYSPSTTVIDSCYRAILNCQLAIFIIGKRYGPKTDNGLSVTHNEYRTVREHDKPVFTLVDQEVLNYMDVFLTNAPKGVDLNYPGMNSPVDSFRFIEEIKSSPSNNAIMGFGSYLEAQDQVKAQIAHLLGDLLKERSGPLERLMSKLFLLRNDRNVNAYCLLVQYVVGNIEEALQITLRVPTFEDFLREARFVVIICDEPRNAESGEYANFYHSVFRIDFYESPRLGKCSIFEETIELNRHAMDYFNRTHIRLKCISSD